MSEGAAGGAADSELGPALREVGAADRHEHRQEPRGLCTGSSWAEEGREGGEGGRRCTLQLYSLLASVIGSLFPRIYIYIYVCVYVYMYIYICVVNVYVQWSSGTWAVKCG